MADAGFRGWRARAYVAALAALAITTLWDLWLLGDHLLHSPRDSDIRAYYVAAQLALRHGWSALYDWHLNYAANVALYPPSHVWTTVPLFSSPPPVAWLAAPLTALPVDAATWLWTLLELVLLAGAAWVAIDGSRRVRVLAVLAVLGVFPAEHGLALGQAALLTAASLPIAVHLLRRRREVAAGLVLLAVCLKPELGLLVPPALLIAGYRRAFAAWLAGAAALALVSVATLGGTGVRAALSAAGAESRLPFNYYLTWKGVFGGAPEAYVVEAAIAAVALVVIWRCRAWRPELPIAVAAVGSVAASPYVHTQDLLVLVLAGVIAAPRLPAWGLAALAAGWVLVEFVWVIGPLPLLLAELVVLGLIGYAGSRSDVDRLAGDSGGRLTDHLAERRVRMDVPAQLPGVPLK